MPINFWKNVLWSDESKFELLTGKQGLEYGEKLERNIKNITCSRL